MTAVICDAPQAIQATFSIQHSAFSIRHSAFSIPMLLLDDLRAEHDLIEAVAGSFRTFVGRLDEDAGVEDFARFLEFFRRYAGDFHHAREEHALFPALVERAHLPGDRGPLAVLTGDHRRLSEQLDQIERLLRGGLIHEPDRREAIRLATDYTRALEHHIDAENSVLFPESEARLRKQGVRELPGRGPTEEETAAKRTGEDLRLRYPPSEDITTIRGDGCVLCPAMGEGCAGLEVEWWNEWEWEEFEDHLPSG